MVTCNRCTSWDECRKHGKKCLSARNWKDKGERGCRNKCKLDACRKFRNRAACLSYPLGDKRYDKQHCPTDRWCMEAHKYTQLRGHRRGIDAFAHHTKDATVGAAKGVVDQVKSGAKEMGAGFKGFAHMHSIGDYYANIGKIAGGAWKINPVNAVSQGTTRGVVRGLGLDKKSGIIKGWADSDFDEWGAIGNHVKGDTEIIGRLAGGHKYQSKAELGLDLMTLAFDATGTRLASGAVVDGFAPLYDATAGKVTDKLLDIVMPGGDDDETEEGDDDDQDEESRRRRAGMLLGAVTVALGVLVFWAARRTFRQKQQ